MPALVIPATFHETFDDQTLALMIEHEVAHIARGDLWTNALMRALCVMFPFHPAAARLAKDLAFAREAAVDAQVSRRDPHRYATLLLDVAARARFDQLPKPVSMDDTALKKRIEMLTDEAQRQSLSVAPLLITAAIVAMVSLLTPAVFAAEVTAPFGAPPPLGTAGTFRHTPGVAGPLVRTGRHYASNSMWYIRCVAKVIDICGGRGPRALPRCSTAEAAHCLPIPREAPDMPFEFKPQHAYDLHIAYQALQPTVDKGPASNDARSKLALWQADKAAAKPNLE